MKLLSGIIVFAFALCIVTNSLARSKSSLVKNVYIPERSKYAELSLENTGRAEVSEQSGSKEKTYVLHLDSESMINIVALLWKQYHIRVCVEDLGYDIKKDVITVQDEVSLLHKKRERVPLSSRENLRLQLAEDLLNSDNSPGMIFDVACERYSGIVSGDTSDEIMTQITANTSYLWKKKNGTYVIFPRMKSILSYNVTLDASQKALSIVVEDILSQAPKGYNISFLEKRETSKAPRLEHAKVTKLHLINTPAIDALSRACEAAGRDFVWTLGGYNNHRIISLNVLPRKTDKDGNMLDEK